MEIRHATARREDLGTLLDAFAGMYVEMIRECGLEGSGFVEDWRPRLVAFFGCELRRGAMAFYLAKAGERFVGSAAIFLNDGKTNQILRDRSATIAGVYVEPAFRRRGLARALTERAVAWARARECASIRLTASSDARALYEGLGFTNGRELVLKL